MNRHIDKIDIGSLELKDQVVSINRVTKVVKGGKNLSFSALVVVGDSAGHVGYGMGKAREVSSAIKKGVEAAKKNIVRVPITPSGSTIPHTVTGRYGSGFRSRPSAQRLSSRRAQSCARTSARSPKPSGRAHTWTGTLSPLESMRS